MSGGALYRARAGLRLIRMMRLVYRAGLTQHALRVLVNGRMHIRAHMGSVPVLVLGRLGSMVATVGIVIMMVVGTPRCRSPIRYIATGIQQVDGENRRARYGITIYRSSVGVTVYGEAVCIVAGSCPGYGRVVAIRAVGNRTVAVRVYLAGGGEKNHCCGNGLQGNSQIFDFHGNMFVWLELIALAGGMIRRNNLGCFGGNIVEDTVCHFHAPKHTRPQGCL